MPVGLLELGRVGTDREPVGRCGRADDDAGIELEADRETSLRQWRLGVERASYEASRAERRYRAVDPDNRLVARGLDFRAAGHLGAPTHRRF